jgi:integrase/recombinase XerD
VREEGTEEALHADRVAVMGGAVGRDGSGASPPASERVASLDLAPAAGSLDPVADLRRLLAAAVQRLPGLPQEDPLDRYAVTNLTVLWLEADKSEHTRRAYYADLADWLGWCGRAGIAPLEARRADVDAWKGTFTVVGRDGGPRPAAAATTARRLAGVSSWYRYLESNDVTDRNPVEAVRRPRTGGTPPLPALDQESAVVLLRHALDRAWQNDSEASWRDAALVHLLFYTGVRVSALTTATVRDLDRDGRHTVLRYRKKGGTRDFVPVPAPALGPLRHYLDVRARRQAVAPSALSGYLLETIPRSVYRPGSDDSGPGQGSALTQRDVWRTLRTLAAQSGIPQAGSITPHTARRTAGTLLLAHGVPVQKVADLLGHQDIRTTRDRYDAHRHKLDSSPAYTLADILAVNDTTASDTVGGPTSSPRGP